MSDRIAKLNDLLRDETGGILKNELDISDEVLVTVIKAEVSPTLEHATIWISIFPQEREKEILENIVSQIYTIQQMLNKRLVMRPVPKIRFALDHSGEHISRIEEILGEK